MMLSYKYHNVDNLYCLAVCSYVSYYLHSKKHVKSSVKAIGNYGLLYFYLKLSLCFSNKTDEKSV